MFIHSSRPTSQLLTGATWLVDGGITPAKGAIGALAGAKRRRRRAGVKLAARFLVLEC
jgi:hypothetical protein